MKSDIVKCPWCNDEKSEDFLYGEGIMFCEKCKESFEWNKHTEVTFTTRKIQYVKEGKGQWK